jgi:hypothetical protein
MHISHKASVRRPIISIKATRAGVLPVLRRFASFSSELGYFASTNNNYYVIISRGCYTKFAAGASIGTKKGISTPRVAGNRAPVAPPAPHGLPVTNAAISNRKFSTVLRSPQRILDPALPSDPGTVLIVPFFSSSLQAQALRLQRLIATPRLEFPATPTKQNSKPISNRYKTPFFSPLFHSSLTARHPSLASVAPTYRKAIMSRNHFTQIPRSKPLMRKVTNADTNQS